MALNSILLTGLSAMRASQAGMKVASQNIANANTPGYVRTELNLQPTSNLGPGAGVEVSSIKRAADRFLATASYIAQAAQGSASARADILARAQAEFGDPTGTNSMFGNLDDFFSALTAIGVDPSSTLRRDDAVSALESMFTEVGRVSNGVQSMISEADQRIADAVASAQNLMNRIASLNDEVRLTKRAGADSSAAENAQSALIDELSKLMDVRVEQLPEGGVHVRTSGGALLVGVDAAQLAYTPSAAPFSTHGVITFNADLGTQSNIEPFLLGGELKGLLQVRDQDLPSLSEALGGFAAGLADALNEVHNENVSSPPVNTLFGRQTGLLATDALNFTGKSIVGVVNSAGNLIQRLTINFTGSSGGAITSEPPGTGPYAFGNTIGGFAGALSTAMAAGPMPGSASFANGTLVVDSGTGCGLVVQQDPTNPSKQVWPRGFAQFFGLNDLVSRPTPIFFESGSVGTNLHGLNAGGQVTYQVRDAAGRFIAQRTVTVSGALAGAGSTWNDYLAALNAPGTGLGEFGSFSMDSVGRVSFAPASGFQVSLQSDSTTRGATGVSFTGLFGLSPAATAGRAVEVQVNPSIAANPSRLAIGRPDLTAAIGDHLIEAGDNRGAAALAAVRTATNFFPAAGMLSAQSTSLSLYAARLGGEAGRMASDAKRDADGAEAVATAADDRRGQVEGVSLDDELLKMTTYQNAYAAAARVIQATTEMFDILLSVGLTG